MITRADLVAAFPEFVDTTKYPDATVTFWINQAVNIVSQDVFGASYTLAVLLYVAHNIVLAAKAAASAAKSSAGDVSGPYSSKTVGSVSKSMDVGSVTNEGAGFWNTTSYGVRYYQLLQAYGAGPRYFPGCQEPTYPYAFPIGPLIPYL